MSRRLHTMLSSYSYRISRHLHWQQVRNMIMTLVTLLTKLLATLFECSNGQLLCVSNDCTSSVCSYPNSGGSNNVVWLLCSDEIQSRTTARLRVIEMSSCTSSGVLLGRLLCMANVTLGPTVWFAFGFLGLITCIKTG